MRINIRHLLTCFVAVAIAAAVTAEVVARGGGRGGGGFSGGGARGGGGMSAQRRHVAALAAACLDQATILVPRWHVAAQHSEHESPVMGNAGGSRPANISRPGNISGPGNIRPNIPSGSRPSLGGGGAELAPETSHGRRYHHRAHDRASAHQEH